MIDECFLTMVSLGFSIAKPPGDLVLVEVGVYQSQIDKKLVALWGEFPHYLE